MGPVKTTIEIPDALFRRVKSHAAEHGMSLKDFVTDALQARLATVATSTPDDEPRWMAGFGKLRRLHTETVRIQGIIDETFDRIETEDRQ